MSYKTNAKSLRLGISHSWSYKAHGPTKDFHIDHKVRSYLMNLIEYVVPQAPKKVKTKAKKERKYPVQPGLQGKTIVLRNSSIISVICFYYLNYDGASPKQIVDFHQNISKLKKTINAETGYKVKLKMINYFIFFWRYEAFLGINTPYAMRNKVNKCINNFGFLQIERSYYSNIKKNVTALKRSVSRFRRQRYFKRTLYPLIGSFIFFDFDCELATKTVALELQILRIDHKRFVHYITKFFKKATSLWNKKFNVFSGLQIKINGRLTNFRRQSRRTQTKIINIGVIKRSNSSAEAGHSIAIAYNRYGSISVQISYQLKPLMVERWENRTPINPQLIFSTRAFIETYLSHWDFKENKSKSVFNDKDSIIKSSENINKKYIEFKKKFIINKEFATHGIRPTQLKLLFSDPYKKLLTPNKAWVARNSFKKYIIKKTKV